jgi:hypothetical protein
MALTKTKTDLQGTQASPTSVTTGQVLTGSLRDVTGKVGLAFIFRVTYSGVTATVRPKLEVFTAGENNASYQDTEAYETVELNYTGTGSYQVTLPIRFAEDLSYINWKITAPTFSAGTVTVYLGIVETNL